MTELVYLSDIFSEAWNHRHAECDLPYSSSALADRIREPQHNPAQGDTSAAERRERGRGCGDRVGEDTGVPHAADPAAQAARGENAFAVYSNGNRS